ncbi:hypothetical protein LJ737_02315 [Hymenobacter sp. 15J16-1T3B]|uniref:toxin-antitoxin system YwqK family antitoxin n=1 Tax=Hymenobacter sp. 15J16-1T3B TaxID=2886941 RepID=UPI001D0FB2CC|nr:hypothetical protein [Hymenobacter sp. 15J16-1T3B]MCC3156049.1 hypothetical protein [Hymenobacter sp. 15J16-1T3B]
MRLLLLALSGVLLAAACTTVRPPIGFWSRNRVRVDGSRQGPWRTYYDQADTRLATRGHYRRDHPTGHWRYYRPEGVLDHTERYHRRGRISIRYYRPNGQLARQGQARVVVEPDTVRFYWYGLWQLYDSTGKASNWELYDKGWRAARGVGPR